MAAEIERKFLVADGSWRDGDLGVRTSQGYLSQDPDRTVRIRIAGEKAWLTIKGRSEGITRAEFEYAWVGAEVSSDVRYFNSCLAVLPYAKW